MTANKMDWTVVVMLVRIYDEHYNVFTQLSYCTAEHWLGEQFKLFIHNMFSLPCWSGFENRSFDLLFQ